jgi:NAD(P) transhydrogenase subunit alpha
VPGKVVKIGHAQVWGGANVPSQMPGPASKLYAQNIVNILTLMTTPGEGAEGGRTAAEFTPDFEDEIVAGSAVTHGGRIVHEPTREAIEGPAEPEPVEPVETPEPEPEPTGPEPTDLPYDQEADQ